MSVYRNHFSALSSCAHTAPGEPFHKCYISKFDALSSLAETAGPPGPSEPSSFDITYMSISQVTKGIIVGDGAGMSTTVLDNKATVANTNYNFATTPIYVFFGLHGGPSHLTLTYSPGASGAPGTFVASSTRNGKIISSATSFTVKYNRSVFNVMIQAYSATYCQLSITEGEVSGGPLIAV